MNGVFSGIYKLKKLQGADVIVIWTNVAQITGILPDYKNIFPKDIVKIEDASVISLLTGEAAHFPILNIPQSKINFFAFKCCSSFD